MNSLNLDPIVMKRQTLKLNFVSYTSLSLKTERFFLLLPFNPLASAKSILSGPRFAGEKCL